MTTASEPQTGPFLHVDDDGVAEILFDDPTRSVNLFTEPVLRRLSELLDTVDGEVAGGRVRGVLFRSGKSGTFIAGADVNAIAAVEHPAEGQEAARFGQHLFLRVDELPVPTLSAIDGTCLGGGVELSLACRHRVASDSPRTSLGLPEVQLGILPAWGGTTRLPRLVGLQAALDLLLTGKTLDARRAQRRGLVDAVLPAAGFAEAARAFLLERIAGPPLAHKDGRGLVTRVLDGPGAPIVLAQARKRVLAQTGGHYPAPLKILDVVRRSRGSSLRQALAYEAEAAGELIASAVSKNLIHVFHLREAARKGGSTDPSATALPVEHLGILGAGVMGGGIAQLAAYNGLSVRVKDIRHDAVGHALAHAQGLFRKAVERRKLDRRDASQRMERISGGVTYDGFAQADLVVEAVVEKMAVKKAVLAEVEGVVRPDAVLASNTSSLSIDEMATALARPERFGGLHFFNPVHRMPLIEVVRGASTSAGTVATLVRLSVRLGKVPVVVRDGPGFLVNRILGPYLNEAGFLLGEGASVEQVDRAARAFGMPMGPLRLIDEVGIDIAQHAGATLFEALGERMRPSPVLERMAASGRLGRKGGVGFYTYEGEREKDVDGEVYGVLGETVPAERRTLEDGDITARLVLTMINEAARILADGIVGRAADVDLAMIMGTGFPPFRGGLLRHADRLHPRAIVERLDELARRVGPRFEPAPLLRELAASDRSFYTAFP
ncbi:MAG: 3-hydroxyacyl-CoA dehydrogenase NAD-binding domain-containing protein [Gemmatimonadota bacterium]|nr:enoyl-CoA hydratase/isomerase family protein [Gemmatimonadota bacterium]